MSALITGMIARRGVRLILVNFQAASQAHEFFISKNYSLLNVGWICIGWNLCLHLSQYPFCVLSLHLADYFPKIKDVFLNSLIRMLVTLI